MRRFGRHIALLLVLQVSNGQDLKFEAQVDPQRVAVGQQFQVSFTVTSTHSVRVRNFAPPDFGGFLILGGPVESSQYQWINGRATSTVSYAYTVSVQKPGKYIIGSASVEHEGNRYSTKPVEIAAVQGQPGGTASTGDQGSLGVDLKENLFIRVSAEKQRVRQGEQFIVTHKLYTRLNVENYVISKAPTFEGFWAEDLDQQRSPEVTNETVEGKQYRVATIKRTALFAAQPGKLRITPMEVRCAVQVRRRSTDPFDIFNDPFFSRLRTQEVDIASNSLTITVDPLPVPAPAGFTGGIGKYILDASIDKREPKTGDAITLKVSIAGIGNVKLLSVPSPVFPTDFETYDPKVTENISREDNLIRGTKTAEFLMIPRNPGERVIEPMTFVYFDLEKNAYVSLRSPRFTLTIAPGKDPFAGGLPSATASKEEIRLLGEDIRFLKLSPGSLVRTDEQGISATAVAVYMVLPVLMFAGSYAYRKRREKLLGNISLTRARKAGREAARRLKSARKLLAQGDTETYHSEVSRALFRYVSDRLQIPFSALSLDSVSDALQGRKVGDDVIGRLKTCLERAEFARFAPGGDSREARADLLDAAASTIDELEDLLNRR
ncbi:MAG: protein BatD [Ignavibacteriales bacterium]|nr:protein BatD [Ignavibacteriales bacterium]